MQTSSWTSTSLPCNCTVPLPGCSQGGECDQFLVGCYHHKEGKYDGGFEITQVCPLTNTIAPGVTEGGAWKEPFGIFDMIVLNKNDVPTWLIGGDVSSEHGDIVLCACTDGKARVYYLELLPSTTSCKRTLLLTVLLHTEMLTSATACCVEEGDRQLLLIAATAHKGGLCVAEVIDLSGACGRLAIVEEAHEFDAWCVSQHPFLGVTSSCYPMLWTGGDDGKVKLWSSSDILAQATPADDGGGKGLVVGASSSSSTPIYSQLRAFDAGVVTIVPFVVQKTGSTAHHASFLLIGSYDENLRCINVTDICDASGPLTNVSGSSSDDNSEAYAAAALQVKMSVVRSMKQTVFEEHLEGGVWRVRMGQGSIHNNKVLIGSEDDETAVVHIAIATMQRGAATLALELSGQSIIVADGSVAHFHERILEKDDGTEQPLVYDVAYTRTGAVVSLSFYDRHVAVSSAEKASE